MSRNDSSPIAQALLDYHLIRFHEMVIAETMQSLFGGTLEENLIECGAISSQEITEFKTAIELRHAMQE